MGPVPTSQEARRFCGRGLGAAVRMARIGCQPEGTDDAEHLSTLDEAHHD